MAFQELILVYWAPTEKDLNSVDNEDFWTFADHVTNSRYYTPPNPGSGRNCNLIIVDTVPDIDLYVRDWCNQAQYGRIQGEYPTVYFGFQGGPGWTLEEFHDILNVVETIPVKFPGVVTSWLPCNWFDHPGLTPTLTSGENALEWMEQQVGTAEPEKITYDFKGVHHE